MFSGEPDGHRSPFTRIAKRAARSNATFYALALPVLPGQFLIHFRNDPLWGDPAIAPFNSAPLNEAWLISLLPRRVP